jgi:nucleotide-binding universal stress UspA family protein
MTDTGSTETAQRDERLVVVGYDGSKASHAALAWAVADLGEAHGKLFVVSVVDDAAPQDRERSSQQLVDEATDDLLTIAATLTRDHPNLRIVTDGTRGDPVDVLRQYSNPTTCVIVGAARHRGGSLHRPLFHSVGERVAAAGRGPVVIDQGPKGPASGIVVGVTDSHDSLAAVEVAAEYATRRHETLILVHAWQEPARTTELEIDDPGYVDWLRGRHRAFVNRVEKAVVAAHPALHVVSHLEDDDAEDALLTWGKSASLVVLGSRGVKPLGWFLPGSLTHRLINDAEFAVALVPPETTVSATAARRLAGVGRL